MRDGRQITARGQRGFQHEVVPSMKSSRAATWPSRVSIICRPARKSRAPPTSDAGNALAISSALMNGTSGMRASSRREKVVLPAPLGAATAAAEGPATVAPRGAPDDDDERHGRCLPCRPDVGHARCVRGCGCGEFPWLRGAGIQWRGIGSGRAVATSGRKRPSRAFSTRQGRQHNPSGDGRRELATSAVRVE